MVFGESLTVYTTFLHSSNGVLITIPGWGAGYMLVTIYLILTAEMLRTGVVPSPSKTRMKRVTATDGTGDALKGVCIFFLRPSPTKPVTVANVAEELVCGQLDTSDGRSILEVIQEYLSEVMMPALSQGQNWGSLQPLQIDNFMNTLKNYINFIKGAEQLC